MPLRGARQARLAPDSSAFIGVRGNVQESDARGLFERDRFTARLALMLEPRSAIKSVAPRPSPVRGRPAQFSVVAQEELLGTSGFPEVLDNRLERSDHLVSGDL
jgi:hypothetical protein